MTEYQFKKREAEFEKSCEAYFKEKNDSDEDYLQEKIGFYYNICQELLKENQKLRKFEKRCNELEERLDFKERVLDKIPCGLVYDAIEDVEKEDQEQEQEDKK